MIDLSDSNATVNDSFNKTLIPFNLVENILIRNDKKLNEKLLVEFGVAGIATPPVNTNNEDLPKDYNVGIDVKRDSVVRKDLISSDENKESDNSFRNSILSSSTDMITAISGIASCSNDRDFNSFTATINQHQNINTKESDYVELLEDLGEIILDEI